MKIETEKTGLQTKTSGAHTNDPSCGHKYKAAEDTTRRAWAQAKTRQETRLRSRRRTARRRRDHTEGWCCTRQPADITVGLAEKRRLTWVKDQNTICWRQTERLAEKRRLTWGKDQNTRQERKNDAGRRALAHVAKPGQQTPQPKELLRKSGNYTSHERALYT